MRISPAGIALVKKYEGCELMGYRDVAGIPTVGFGHTGSDVRVGMVITQAQADELLAADLRRTETAVSAICGPATNQGQFDALVSFAFNLGVQALLKSTLLKKHKAGQYHAAALQFPLWNHVRKNGQLVPLAGLTARRAAERKLYEGVQ